MMSTNRLDSFSILTSQQYCATFCNPNIFHLFLTLCMLKGCSFSRPFKWCIFQGLKGWCYFDEGRQRLVFFCHQNWHFFTKIVLLIDIPLEVETWKKLSQLRLASTAAPRTLKRKKRGKVGGRRLLNQDNFNQKWWFSMVLKGQNGVPIIMNNAEPV